MLNFIFELYVHIPFLVHHIRVHNIASSLTRYTFNLTSNISLFYSQNSRLVSNNCELTIKKNYRREIISSYTFVADQHCKCNRTSL